MDRSERVLENRPCVGCGYNLRSLNRSERCPECGLEIVRSYCAYDLPFAAPSWRRRVRLGVTLILAALAVVGLGWVGWAILGLGEVSVRQGEPTWALRLTVGLQWVTVACAGMGFIGSLLALGAEPARRHVTDRWRQIGVTLTWVVGALGAGLLFSPYAQGARLGFPLMFALGGGLAALAIVSTVIFCRLLRRSPLHGRRARIVLWVVTACVTFVAVDAVLVLPSAPVGWPSELEAILAVVLIIAVPVTLGVYAQMLWHLRRALGEGP